MVSVVTLVDLWHATRKTSDPLPVPDYQVVRAALLDPGNILDLVPVTQQTVLRHEGIAHPS